MNKNIKHGLALVVSLAFTGLAMAADPDPGLDAISGLATRAAAYIAAAAAVALVVAGGFWGITFMKKAFSRAG
jgi:hypothetical protein